jgi:polygalacturonase
MLFASSKWLAASVLISGACMAGAACSSANAPVQLAPPPPDSGGGGGDSSASTDAPASGDGGGLACGSSTSTTVMTPFAAPNNMLTFTTPTIPCNMFKITDYAAKGDGATKNTDAFKQAVAAAKAAGGGVVDVPSGNWLTGPIHLDSNIELHLEAGAVVTFSPDFADYGPPATPLVPTRWEGLDIMNWSPLVYCLNCTNVAITGSGKLFGNGAYWWDWKSQSAVEDANVYNAIYASIQANGGIPGSGDGGAAEAGTPAEAGSAAEAGMPSGNVMQTMCGPIPLPTSGKLGSATASGLRPTMVECNGCKNFLIQGVTIQDGPYWIVHPVYSENVIVRNAHILSGQQTPLSASALPSNGDGLDIDSCKNILVEDTDFTTSDDNIAIKSGLNEDGICVNRPSEEVVLRRITSIAGHGGMTVGSEMSGGITNVFGTDSTLTGTGVQYPLRFKTLVGRGGTISNIFYDSITMANWTNGGIIIDMSYPSSTVPVKGTFPPTIKSVSFSNLSGPNNTTGTTMTCATATCPPVTFKGTAQSPLQAITLTNVKLDGTGATCLGGMGQVTLTNVAVPGLPANGPWTCP